MTKLRSGGPTGQPPVRSGTYCLAKYQSTPEAIVSSNGPVKRINLLSGSSSSAPPVCACVRPSPTAARLARGGLPPSLLPATLIVVTAPPHPCTPSPCTRPHPHTRSHASACRPSLHRTPAHLTRPCAPPFLPAAAPLTASAWQTRTARPPAAPPRWTSC